MVILFGVLLIPMAIKFETMGVVYALAIIGLTAQLGRYFLITRVARVTGVQIAIRLAIPILIGIIAYIPGMLAIGAINVNLPIVRFIVGLLVITLTFGFGILVADQKMKFGVTEFFLQHFPRLNKVFRTFRLVPDSGTVK